MTPKVFSLFFQCLYISLVVWPALSLTPPSKTLMVVLCSTFFLLFLLVLKPFLLSLQLHFAIFNFTLSVVAIYAFCIGEMECDNLNVL